MSALSFIACGVFVAVILILQSLDPLYNPVEQHMSELAFGPGGAMLPAAFCALALALLVLAVHPRMAAGTRLIRLAPATAALAFLGAGVIGLPQSVELHVLFVALAFVSSGLGMLLLPRAVTANNRLSLLTSRMALVLFAASAGSSGILLSPGLAQRLAVVVLLLWCGWVSVRLSH